MSKELTPEEQLKLSGQGFLLLKDPEYYSVRVLLNAGIVSTKISKKISQIAEKYGKGYYILTQRLNIEIPFIKHEDLEQVKSEVESVGCSVGGTGKRVRGVHACKGSVCRFGLYDTEKVSETLMQKFYKEYYKVILPNKFRIAVSGCPISCSKPQLNDIGLVGREKGKVDVYFGGMYGRKVKQQGTPLVEDLSPEEAEEYIKRAIEFYSENGEPGERFPLMVKRLGADKVKGSLLS